MLVRIKNKIDRLLIIALNSGKSTHLMPGGVSSEIDEIEIANNPKIKKLKELNAVSIEMIGKKTEKYESLKKGQGKRVF